MARLIITNGDAAAVQIRAAGVEAEMLPWRDALHDGPVPSGLILEALSLVRAPFLASEFGQPLAEITARFATRDATARNHGQYDRVELWFEHDLYDQLQLIQLLDFFASERRSEGLFLAQSNDYLATYPAIGLLSLEDAAISVTDAHFQDAARAWAAFTASTPEGLAARADVDVPALPHLADALHRLIGELPAIGSGLSLTQENVLSALAEAPRTAGELFAATQDKERARFLSDASFFRCLDDLGFAATPLIEGLPFGSKECADGPDNARYGTFARATLSVTDAGRAALAERFDHAGDNGIDRWFGGTHLTTSSMWRRNRAGGLAT